MALQKYTSHITQETRHKMNVAVYDTTKINSSFCDGCDQRIIKVNRNHSGDDSDCDDCGDEDGSPKKLCLG